MGRISNDDDLGLDLAGGRYTAIANPDDDGGGTMVDVFVS